MLNDQRPHTVGEAVVGEDEDVNARKHGEQRKSAQVKDYKARLGHYESQEGDTYLSTHTDEAPNAGCVRLSLL